jgi:hypothetical protein
MKEKKKEKKNPNNHDFKRASNYYNARLLVDEEAKNAL